MIPYLKHVVAEAGEGPVFFTADFDVSSLSAAVDGGLHIFPPGLYPLHRPRSLHGCIAQHGFFRIDVKLGAEAAAHFGRDQAQLVFRYAQHE